MIKLNYIENNDFYELNYNGEIKINEIKEYLNSLYMMETPDIVKFLHNGHDATFKIEPEEIDSIKQIALKILDKHTMVKIASLHNDPEGTSLSILASYNISAENFRYKTFSTKDAALLWLLDS